MVRLRVRELAEEAGLNLSQLQIAAGIAASTARRLWYGTMDGKENTAPITRPDLAVLEHVARVLSARLGYVVTVRDVLKETDEPWPKKEKPKSTKPKSTKKQD